MITGKAIKTMGFQGFIDVYGVANAVLTATTTDKTYTATADSNGYARIKVKRRGAYTIGSTGTNRSAYATVSNATPVTAQYHWNKYQAPIAYSQAANYYEYRYHWHTEPLIDAGNFYGMSVYRNCASYWFNASTGMYHMSGGTGVVTIDSGDFAIAYPPGTWDNYVHAYGGYPGYTDTTPILYEVWKTDAVGGVGFNYMSWIGGIGLSGTADNIAMAGYRRYSTSYYYKGDYIGVSNGANLSTYPTDARASDGYWYVAI